MDRGITGAGITSRFNRVDWIFVLLLITLTLATRLPFRSPLLVIGDSVHYVLGMEHFDVSEYRPHPPGTFLYITTAKAFAVLLDDANQSLIAIAILFSVGAVVFLYLLSRDMFSREVGIVACLLFLFVPLFWYYGEIAMRHAGSACFTAAIAFLSYRVYSRGDNKLWVYLVAGVLGLSGGVAQDVFIFTFPLVAFSVYKSWPGWQVFWRALGIFGVSVASWYVPTVLLSGGYAAYSRTVAEQSRDYFTSYSIVFGNSWFRHFRMLKDLALYCIVGNCFASGYAIVYLITMGKPLWRRMRGQRFIFLMFWLFPPILYWAILFFDAACYLLAVLPSVYLIFGYMVVELTKRLVPVAKLKLALAVQVGIITLVHTYIFLGQPPRILANADGKPFTEKTWTQAALSSLHAAFFENTYTRIVAGNQATETYVRGIRSLPYNPNEVAILHFQRSPWVYGLDYYYLPEYSVYQLEDYRDEVKKVRYGKNHELKYIVDRVIRLSPAVRCVVVICQRGSPTYRELAQQVSMTTVPLGEGYSLLSIENQVISFRSRGFFFTNEP
jgi:hypothetical protein